MNSDVPTSASTVCLAISNVGNVDLECGGHHVPTLLIQNSHDIHIANCTQDDGASTAWCQQSVGAAININVVDVHVLFSFDVQNSVNVTATTSTFGCGRVNKSQQVTITNNHLTNDWRIIQASVLSFSGNHLEHFGTYGLTLSNGMNNSVVNNQIIGGWDGRSETGVLYDLQHPDDGIVVDDEQGDSITDNVIQNVFDAGIESLDSSLGNLLAKNNISNAGMAGFAAYFGTSWDGNTISGNHVSNSHFFMVGLSDAAYGMLIAPLGFTNTVIEGNTSDSGLLMRFTVPASNNIIRNNNFGNTAWTLEPAAGFVDGGGNVCFSAPSFTCLHGGTTSVRRRWSRSQF